MNRSSRPNPAFLLRLELASRPELLGVVRGAMGPLMEGLGFTAEHTRAIVRAVDEALSNIMRHSYGGRLDQSIEIRCSSLKSGADEDAQRGIEILLFDRGPAVDPTKLEPRSLDEIRPGGLGLHIIRDSMDAFEYKRDGDLNRLRLVKYTRPAGALSESEEEKP